MPVTARLSREFYDTLGEDIAQELVDWFNMVDATYRQDLFDTNELNFARFDAKLEQRVTELDTKWEQRIAQLNAKWDQRIGQLDGKWEKRIAQLDARWERRFAQLDAEWEKRFGELDAKLQLRVGELHAKLELRVGELDAKLVQCVADLNSRMDTGFTRVSEDVERRIASLRTDVIKWMFVFWATNALIVFGLMSRFFSG